MSIVEIIEKKKKNIELSKQEIDFLVNGYVFEKTILDYHVAALLMAFRLNGMTDNEIFYLTNAFIETSEKYEFNKNTITIDKHSSGGVGDKITLIVQPILMSLGFAITKISGRGLGHTGGTIDKLDSINFNSSIDFKKANKIFAKTNSILLQQTEKLVPADKMFYALRDVTSTVDTMGLIVSSILSKKFVVNSDYIFIDLKVGSGALLTSEKDAKELANKMLKIANMFNRKLFIHLTNMDQPLGNAIGNAIEVKEACDFLLSKNQNTSLQKLVCEFIVDILLATNKAKNKKEAQTMYLEALETHSAYNKMLEWFESQSVNIESIKKDNFFKPKYEHKIYAKKEGYIKFKSAADVGNIALKLGAGRVNKNDMIDYQAGIYLNNIQDRKININEHIATLYSSKQIDKSLINEFESIIIYDKTSNKNVKMIINKINN